MGSELIKCKDNFTDYYNWRALLSLSEHGWWTCCMCGLACIVGFIMHLYHSRWICLVSPPLLSAYPMSPCCVMEKPGKINLPRHWGEAVQYWSVHFTWVLPSQTLDLICGIFATKVHHYFSKIIIITLPHDYHLTLAQFSLLESWY